MANSTEPKLKAQPLDDKKLEGLIGKPIKLFLLNGKALEGKLLEFDRKSLIISPETVVQRKHVTTFYASGTGQKTPSRKKPPVR